MVTFRSRSSSFDAARLGSRSEEQPVINTTTAA